MAIYASSNPPPYAVSREPKSEPKPEQKSELNNEDWEDWEDDDEPITPIDAGEQVHIDGPPPARHSVRHLVNHGHQGHQTHRASRHSARVSRPRSRRRQKAQNEKAGIKLITDINSFMGQSQQPGRPIKFVDAAALRALEGEPNSASVGNWNWLNKKSKGQSQAVASPQLQETPTPQSDRAPQSALPIDHGLSPEDRPIMIGFAMDADVMEDRRKQLQTVAVNPQPSDRQRLEIPSNSTSNQQHQSSDSSVQQTSVWSPDTPDTASSFTSARYTSSVYSHMPSPIVGLRTPDPNAPPVPAVPSTFKKLVNREMSHNGADDEDSGTPCTLFEEDGDRSPRRRTLLTKAAGVRTGAALTPDSAASKSNGWWDHVVTPFMEKNFSFAPRKQKVDSLKTDEEDNWWNGSEPKPAQGNRYLTPTLKPLPLQTPVIVRVPTPRRTPSPQSGPHPQPPSPPSPASRRDASSESFRRAPSPESLRHAHLESSRRAPSPEPFRQALPSESAGRAPSPSRRMSSRRSRRISYRRTSSRRTSSHRSMSPRLVIAMEYDSGPSTRVNEEPRQPSPVNEKPPIIMMEERHVEQPPPYSPPDRQTDQESNVQVRYRAVFPPGHPLGTQFPPTPGPTSPGLSATMSSQGGTQMTEVPLTPGPEAPPARHLGTYLTQRHSHETSVYMTQTERTRECHEREKAASQKAGGCFGGRGCAPKKGCLKRKGREDRKRRRRCCTICCCILFLLLVLLGVLLGVLLTRNHHTTTEAQSIWVNLTDFPPMPTGVMTVVGPDNSVSRSGCTEPETLWSCSLPKEEHDDVSPYSANQPTVILQIQWDNDTANSWNVSNGDPPTPIPRRSLGGAAYAGSVMRERSSLEFNPNPDAPSYKEEWFLGNTTDGVESDEKGGEPTPFYISLLNSLSDASGSEIVKRDINVTLSDYLPAPSLNSDGTPKGAVMLPTPYQQPVRLYDRGLATERYSFYNYFSRTIFLKSVNATDNETIPLDENGGCRETEANYLVTWSQTRVLVEIWTRTLDANTSTLFSSDGQEAINGTEQLIRPGTMPYPVTVTLDTHGGEITEKFVWAWPMDSRQQLDEDSPQLLANDMSVYGTWINKRSTGKAKYGGYDGGTGGCKCEWVNWESRSKS